MEMEEPSVLELRGGEDEDLLFGVKVELICLSEALSSSSVGNQTSTKAFAPHHLGFPHPLHFPPPPPCRVRTTWDRG